MNAVPEVTDFMERVQRDPRLGPLHISLYMAILYFWVEQGQSGPARISGRELMPVAKVGRPKLLYSSLRMLHEAGYIVYQPSYNPAEKSKFFLPLLERMGYLWKG